MSGEREGPDQVELGSTAGAPVEPRPLVELERRGVAHTVTLLTTDRNGAEKQLAWWADLDRDGTLDVQQGWFWRRVWTLTTWAVRRYGPPGLARAVDVADQVIAELARVSETPERDR